MRTVSFKSVCDRALQRYGTDPDVETENTTMLLAVGSAIHDCTEEGWQWSDFPDVTDVAEVTPSADGVIEMAGDLWRVYGLYKSDPRVQPDTPRVDFTDLGERVQIIGTTFPTTVWAKYWLPPSEFSRVPYSETGTYVAGDVRYFDGTGECYKALAQVQGVPPDSDATKWAKQNFPLVLRNWAALNGAAALHQDDGQFDKANSLKADALDALLLEQDNFKSRTMATA